MMFHAKINILIFARNHVSLQFIYFLIHEDILNTMMDVVVETYIYVLVH